MTHQKKIQQALHGVKILEEEKLTQIIYDSLFKIQADMGLNLGSDELKNLVNTFTIDIARDFMYLTVQEIQLALYLGARGELEKTYGLSAVVCYKWVKAYSIMRKEYRRAPERKQLEGRKIDYYKPDTEKEFYDFLIDTVKKFNEIPFGWNYCPVYRYMKREGMLNLTKQDIKDVQATVRMNKIQLGEIKILEDEQQFDVLFRSQAVKDYLTKTYGVKRRDFRLKKVQGNIVKL